MTGLLQRFSDSASPGGDAYKWAARLSWLAGLAAAGILFVVIPHWYLGLPVALIGFWLTTGLGGASWAVIRVAFFWKREPGDDRRHLWLHRLAVVLLLPATVVGVAGLLYVPNWKDFEFNGHPSLLAAVGSVGVGILAFVLGFGLTAWVPFRLTVRLLGLRDYQSPQRNG